MQRAMLIVVRHARRVGRMPRGRETNRWACWNATLVAREGSTGAGPLGIAGRNPRNEYEAPEALWFHFDDRVDDVPVGHESIPYVFAGH